MVQCGICQMVAVGVSLRGLLWHGCPGSMVSMVSMVCSRCRRFGGVRPVSGGSVPGVWRWSIAMFRRCGGRRLWSSGLLWFAWLLGGGVCWPGLVGVSCFGWLSVAALGAARGTVSGCFRTPVVVWLVPLVWGPLQVLLGLVRGRLFSFRAGGPVAVPVGVVLSGLVVVFVPVVLCCPWLGAGVGSAAQHIL